MEKKGIMNCLGKMSWKGSLKVEESKNHVVMMRMRGEEKEVVEVRSFR